MKNDRRRQLVVLLAIALAVRLAAGWAWQERLSGLFALGDSESYWQLGRAIAEGQPYEYEPEHAQVFRTPGYPLLLAPVFWLAGDGPDGVLLARAEAALFGTLAVLAVWWLTRLLFDDRAAWIAAILATFYPGAIALSVLVLSEAPFCPLMLLQLGLWILAWNAETPRRRVGWGFAAGLAAGAATLMRPSWLLFTPLAAAVFVVIAEKDNSRGLTAPGMCADRRIPLRELLAPGYCWDATAIRRKLVVASAMMLGLVVMMTPWWIRNARVTGRFVPTTLQVGPSLYDGLNPNATGASNMKFVTIFVVNEIVNMTWGGPLHPRKPYRDFHGTLELQVDQRMREEAFDWARTHLGRVLQLAGIKFLRMWNVWPNEPELARSWLVRFGVLFTYTPLLILAIMGAWRTLGRGWPYILCWLPAVYLTLLHVVFVSSLRYREPAMLALLALAAGEIAIRDWGLGIRDWRRRLRPRENHCPDRSLSNP